jgi:hypothetical protein
MTSRIRSAEEKRGQTTFILGSVVEAVEAMPSQCIIVIHSRSSVAVDNSIAKYMKASSAWSNRATTLIGVGLFDK